MVSRIGAVVGKEFRHLLRDPRMLAMVLVMPVFQLLLFSYAISFDVRNVPMVVVDTDHTPASRHFVTSFSASEIFRVVKQSDSVRDIDPAFESNTATIALVVPAGFGEALARGEPGGVGVLVDGTQTIAAKVARSAAIALTQRYGQQLAVTWANGQDADPASFGGLDPRLRTWYNPELRSSDFLIPGLMVVILMIVTVQQTAIAVVRERDQGTSEQLTVSRLRRGELMFGKLLPWTLLAFVEIVLITLLALCVFGVPLRGSVAALAVGSTLFVFAALGLGLVISAIAPNMDVANLASILIAFLPAFLLSEFAFPLDQVPTVLQWFSMLFPGRYMVDISRAVFLKGGSFPEVWPNMAALAAYAAATLMLSSLLYRRRES